MSMDALTKIALKTLLENRLPELKMQLESLLGSEEHQCIPNEELQKSIEESYQLLTILGKWAKVEEPKSEMLNISTESTKSDMSDEEAMAALAAMDGDSSTESNNSDMSDEEAMAALAAMDDDSSTESTNSDMSDEEAMAALAAMDDDSSTESTNSDMSDEEAMAALAVMDGSETQCDDSNLSDEEAMAAFAAMDDDTSNEDKIEKSEAEIEENDSDEFNVEKIGEIAEFGDSEFGQDPEMIKDFMLNATELMEVLDEQILNLEQNPEDKETIEEIFRAAHTLKGAAGMFGYQAIERVMHRMENFFDQVRREKLVATPDSIDVVLEGIDVLKVLMEAVEAGEACGFKTATIVRDLSLVAAGKFKKSSEDKNKKTEKTSETVEKSSESTKQKSKAKPKKKEDPTIRVDIKRLDTLVNLVGELVTDRTRFINIEEELHTHAPQLSTTANMSETVQLFGRHMNEIQETIMKVRMVPIGNAFNKFTRIIRDLSRQLNKEIDLNIEGESTELDKTLVEQIADPLVHLIRNSCDHGIENPEDRIANGKSSNGTIHLSAKQEGNHIVITIQDDGKGIPAEIIRKKAIEKGLISEDDILNNKEIFSLIFEPGFSTAEQVTNISGRGVGMDVVKKQIQKLKGIIDIDSVLGKGTTITIQLPLTLAILQSLLVRSNYDTFAIPLNAVVESIRISPEEIQKVGGTEVIKRRNQVLPLFNLEDVLELDKKDDQFWYQPIIPPLVRMRTEKLKRKKQERIFVVVVGTAERRFGLVVDSLLHQQEMVIKPLGGFMKEIPCVAGGAILGSGEVVLVLDIVDIDSIYRSKTRVKIAA